MNRDNLARGERGEKGRGWYVDREGGGKVGLDVVGGVRGRVSDHNRRSIEGPVDDGLDVVRPRKTG